MLSRCFCWCAVVGIVHMAGVPAVLSRSVQTGRNCYADEAGKDPTLVAFRNGLLGAIRARSAMRLRPLVADDVYITKESEGWSRFVDLYRLRDARSPYWKQLDDILSRDGGRFMNPDLYCAPSASCLYPPPWGRDKVVVLFSGVNAHERASSASPVIQRLSCDVLKTSTFSSGEPEPVKDWIAVRLQDGRWAYVEEPNAGSPYGLYVRIERRQGKWSLTAFAGPE